MYAFARFLRGWADVRLEGAEPARFLNLCAESGVALRRPEPIDDFTLRLRIDRRSLPAAEKAAARSGCMLHVERERGAPKTARRLRRRWILCAGALLCALSLLWASLHVWALDLSACAAVPEPVLLAALDRAGVRIGSFWPAFSNERIRSRVLCELPQLSWMAVQVRGSRVVVKLREAVPAPAVVREREAADVVAGKAGLVVEVRALRGEAAVQPGQTVLAGETLVSGELHSSFEKARPRRVHAVAEVRARTWYELSACAPLERTEKRPTGRERLRLALEIGGRRINFYDNSRNLPGEYDKLTRTYELSIPGVFTLPLGLTVERLRAYETEAETENRSELAAVLRESLLERLRQEIGGDGEIRESAFSAAERDGMLYVTLRAECLENIAREKVLP